MRKIVPQRCRVSRNRKLDKAGLYYSLMVGGFRTPRRIYPGQFIHVRTANGNDPFLRRAFSVADFNEKTGNLEIVYKVVGRGTACLTQKTKDDTLDLIGPLGNRFAPLSKKQTVVMVAGGIGLPPLYFLARHLTDRGHDPGKILFFYGGRTKDDLIEMRRLRGLGIDFNPCTDDGSYGFKGFVTDAVAQRLESLSKKNTFVCGCGPEPMLAALQDLTLETGFSGEVSLEAPMPCGVGVCLGCVRPSLKNPGQYLRVCRDGPVFKIGEVQI